MCKQLVYIYHNNGDWRAKYAVGAPLRNFIIAHEEKKCSKMLKTLCKDDEKKLRRDAAKTEQSRCKNCAIKKINM